MPNNNPDGVNVFGGPNEHELPYGELRKQEALTHLAPTSQPTAITAPRRAQERATQGKSQPAAVAAPPPMQPQAQPDMQQFWTEIIQNPDASPLVRSYAQKALNG